MFFNEYYAAELKKSAAMNENILQYGDTTTCSANEPFVAAHKHTYYVNTYGFGWTGPATDGNAHIHQIIDFKIVPEGDGHTHDLEPATKHGSDAVEGIDPVKVLIDPMKGSVDV